MKNDDIKNIKVQLRRKEKREKLEDKPKKTSNYSFIIKVTLIGFIVSMIFSASSEIIIPKINFIFGLIILLFVIATGVIFDMIGVAVTASDPKALHSMNARKVKGAKMAVKLIKNTEKVSSICNDVAGDICGIVSGATGSIIAISIINQTNINPFVISLLVTSVISALTIGGKAICKNYAIHKSNLIVFRVAKLLTFKKEEK